MWGIEPWDNDPAADWFTNLMETTKLPTRLRSSLLKYKQNDHFEYTAEIRAAIFCMVQFCRVYVWPIEKLDEDLLLAIEASEAITHDTNYFFDDEIKVTFENDLRVLKSRLSN